MSYELGDVIKILIPGELTREWLSTRTNTEVHRQLDHTESYLETLFPSTQLLDSSSTRRGILTMENYYKYLFRKLDLDKLERIIQVRKDLLKLHLEQVD